jgi:hypothetical protein
MKNKMIVLREIGFFVSKYKHLCKSVSTQKNAEVIWDEDEIVRIFDTKIISEMKRDEQHIVTMINKIQNIYPDWICELTAEKIKELEKKHDCISK